MLQVELPSYRWLISRHEGRFVTNVYSGSTGTLPDAGYTCTKTFHYKVYADSSSGEESKFRLIAETYLIQPWHLGGGKTDAERAEFACSEQGILQAAKWLAETSVKYGF